MWELFLCIGHWHGNFCRDEDLYRSHSWVYWMWGEFKVGALTVGTDAGLLEITRMGMGAASVFI